MRRSSRVANLVVATAAWLFAACCPLCYPQSETYCTINKATIDKLTNATRVTLSADGVVQGAFRALDYWEREGNSYEPRLLKRFPFQLPKARTALGSFIDVSAFPISHIHMSIPRESREGVGLDVEVVLYRRAHLEQIRFSNWGSTGTWDPTGHNVRIEPSRDGRSIIITARTSYHRPPAESKEYTPPTRTSLAVSADARGQISVTALNVELGRVLGAVGDAAGLQIAIRGGANYRSSMSVTDCMPDRLMRAIARAYGLSVRSVGGIYFVTEGLPTEVDSYWAAPTAAFQLHHIAAEEALELLPEFLLRYVHVDLERNALVATGPSQLLDKLHSDLTTIDQPVPQIRLRATIIERVAKRSLERASEMLFADGTHELQIGDAGRLGYRVASQRMDDLHLKLAALQSRGLIRTTICPTVTTASGRTGEIFLGQRLHFAFQGRASGGGGSGQEVVLESVDVGSSIFALPWTGDSEHIRMRLRMQANTVLSVSDAGLPLVATRSVEGTVQIRSGDVIVLGGLVLESHDRTRRGTLPVGLPLAGHIGQAKARRLGATEALVLLSADAVAQGTRAVPPGQRPPAIPRDPVVLHAPKGQRFDALVRATQAALTEGGAWVTVIRGELKPRFRSTDLVCIGDPGDSKVAGLVHRLSGDLRVSRRRASRRAPLPLGLAEIWRPKSGTILVGSNPWDETRRVVLVEGFAPPQSREPAQRPDPLAAWRG